MLKQKIKKIIQFILNPHFLLCFGIAWLITNGWSYVLLAVGTIFGIGWMTAVAGAYLAFLWLPISPEKDRYGSNCYRLAPTDIPEG